MKKNNAGNNQSSSDAYYTQSVIRPPDMQSDVQNVQPAQYVQPQPPRKKKSNKLIWILGIILAFCVFAVIGALQNPKKDNPQLSSSSSHQLTPHESYIRPAHAQPPINTQAVPIKATQSNISVDQNTSNSNTVQLDPLPEPNGFLFVVINDNNPDFGSEDLQPSPYEHFSPLDAFGRVGVANAILGKETLPTERRGDIGHVKPAGWKQAKYDFIKTKDLYNRSHLIAYQLSGENDNPLNLTTGTRQLNQVAMVMFENKTFEYINSTNNHVRYRITPHFVGDELVPRGIQMEAESIEDQGAGLCYNVYIYNIQPGVTINYATGESTANGEDTRTLNPPKGWNKSGNHTQTQNTQKPTVTESQQTNTETTTQARQVIIHGNRDSKIYHMPGQRDYNNISEKNLIIFHSEAEARAAGYRKAKR